MCAGKAPSEPGDDPRMDGAKQIHHGNGKYSFSVQADTFPRYAEAFSSWVTKVGASLIFAKWRIRERTSWAS